MKKVKYVKNALHLDNCEYLTNFLREISKSGQGKGDIQCPSTSSVRSHPILDQLLEEFTPRMEEETGKKLFPTYSYARFYEKGDILHCHLDRPSCEYSVTITLGHDKDVWPIYFAEKGEETDIGKVGCQGEIYRIKDPVKFDIPVGDAVIYDGCELPHWRDVLETEWQAQIFLHYVDQDGPYADYKFDKRPCLSHHNVDEPVVDNNETLYWYAINSISRNSCQQMIEKFEQQELEQAMVGVLSGDLNTDVRHAERLVIPNEIGIGATLTGMGLNINKKAWNFDITHSNQSEFLRYGIDGNYKSHVDTAVNPNQKECRKLTVLAFLNDDFEGGRFYIENSFERFYPEQEAGTVLVFPSFLKHGVEPVTKGVRRSIVTWMVGPWFK